MHFRLRYWPVEFVGQCQVCMARFGVDPNRAIHTYDMYESVWSIPNRVVHIISMYGLVWVVPKPSHTYWYWLTNSAGQYHNQKCNCCTFDHGTGRPNWSDACGMLSMSMIGLLPNNPMMLVESIPQACIGFGQRVTRPKAQVLRF